MNIEFSEITNRYILVRHALNLKPTAIAEQSGLTKGYISKVENHKSAISLRLISFLCSTFDVNLNWLFTGNGAMFNSKSSQAKDMESLVVMLENERRVMLQIIQNLTARSKSAELPTGQKEPNE